MELNDVAYLFMDKLCNHFVSYGNNFNKYIEG